MINKLVVERGPTKGSVCDVWTIKWEESFLGVS